MGILGVWSGQRFRAGLRLSKRLACAVEPQVGIRGGYPPEGTVTIWCNPQRQKQLAADADHGWDIKEAHQGGSLDLETHRRQAT